MKKYLIFLVLLYSVLNGFVLANEPKWLKFTDSVSGDVWFVDYNSYEKLNNKAIFDIKVIQKDNITVKGKYSFRCSDKTHKPIVLWMYDNGKLVRQLEFNDVYPYYNIKTGSVLEELFFLCE